MSDIKLIIIGPSQVPSSETGSSAVSSRQPAPAPQTHKAVFSIAKGRRGAHKFGVSGVFWYPVDTGLFVTGSFDHDVKVRTWVVSPLPRSGSACLLHLTAAVLASRSVAERYVELARLLTALMSARPADMGTPTTSMWLVSSTWNQGCTQWRCRLLPPHTASSRQQRTDPQVRCSDQDAAHRWCSSSRRKVVSSMAYR